MRIPKGAVFIRRTCLFEAWCLLEDKRYCNKLGVWSMENFKKGRGNQKGMP